MIAAAKKVLRENDVGVFTRPGPKQYPHQWNWDSALIALGLSHFDLERALLEVRSLLAGQWRDGMLPHVVYHGVKSDYFPDPGYWRITGSPHTPKTPTSGITQPPLLASIIYRIHQRQPILEFIREVYPALLHWHRWLHEKRDADGTGLVCIIHPWESGTDDSPRWLELLKSVEAVGTVDFNRGDTRYVDATERPFQHDYQHFIYLIDLFRKHNYDQKALIENSPFLVQDVLFNSILYRANLDLKSLGVELGEDTSEINGWLACIQDGFIKRFWDEEQGLFYDYDLRHQRPIRVSTGVIFLPLYASLATRQQAERLVQDHFHDPVHYGVDKVVRYRLTSASKSLPGWDARRYWRGPVWILLNWLVSEGMRDYGFEREAELLRGDALQLMDTSGFREYYDARDGSGCGSEGFSWSAALAIEWLQTRN
ncbi:MAG: glycoside hydrolase [Anaerolineales bacterium]|nr:glycoside hydrolase [Anaerolineales bacterium]